jgi:hypothetical protein
LFRRTSYGVLQRTGSLYGENQRSEGSLGGPMMARDNADHRRFASIKRAVARTLQSGLDELAVSAPACTGFSPQQATQRRHKRSQGRGGLLTRSSILSAEVRKWETTRLAPN